MVTIYRRYASRYCSWSRIEASLEAAIYMHDIFQSWPGSIPCWIKAHRRAQ